MSRVYEALHRSAKQAGRQLEENGVADTIQRRESNANLDLLYRDGDAQQSERPSSNARSVNARSAEFGCRTAGRDAIAAGQETPEFVAIAEDLVHGEHGQAALLSPQSQAQIAKLVHQVFIFANSSAPQVVVFSSVDHNIGSTEICFHTARVLATQVTGSVCLVDANFDACLLQRLVGGERLPGFSDAVGAIEPIKDFAIQAVEENLWLIPAGSGGGTGIRFTADRVRSRLAELRKEFDYILIDTPPPSSAPSAVLLGQMADGVILIVEANSTRRDAARLAKETLEGANVKLLGAILNNHMAPIPKLLSRKL